MVSSYKYFLAFFKNRIDRGAKQIDISKKTGISTAWINKIYKDKAKHLTIEQQKKIVDCFEISYAEMLREGKKLYEIANPEDVVSEGETNELTDLLMQALALNKEKDERLKVAEECLKKYEMLLERNELFLTIFNNINEGVTFFDDTREFVFSSNRWKFLDEEDLAKPPNIDTLVLKLRKKVINFDQLLECLLLASAKKEGTELEVRLVCGETFHIKGVPVFSDKVYKGLLIINTPILNTPIITST